MFIVSVGRFLFMPCKGFVSGVSVDVQDSSKDGDQLDRKGSVEYSLLYWLRSGILCWIYWDGDDVCRMFFPASIDMKYTSMYY